MPQMNLNIARRVSDLVTVSVSYSIEWEHVSESENEMKVVYETAFTRMDEALSKLINHVGENGSAMKEDRPKAVDVCTNGELRVASSGGKQYVKYHGGRWVKWGVNVWPEVLKASGIDISMIDPEKGMPVSGADIEMVDDKPKRVIRLDTGVAF